MMIWRMTAPAGAVSPFSIRGRTYAVSAGSFLDVPDFDGEALASHGWVVLARNVVTTANRPVNVAAGTKIFDSTVGANVVSDGKGGWLHHASGASA